jgi:hypothetical protein
VPAVAGKREERAVMTLAGHKVCVGSFLFEQMEKTGFSFYLFVSGKLNFIEVLGTVGVGVTSRQTDRTTKGAGTTLTIKYEAEA